MQRLDDDTAWAELHGRLHAFIARRIRDRHDADDIAQDVLLRLHRHAGDLRAPDRLDAFAYRIARNAITDHFRAGARARELPVAPQDLAAGLAAEGDRADATASQDLARCLGPLVQRLGERDRRALQLTDLGALSQADAARLLGLSIPGMKSRVQRARARLHDLLTRCCIVELDRRRGIAEVRRPGPCACGAPAGDHAPVSRETACTGSTSASQHSS
ncbi:MAG TPA: sigma-70 family RNA polymerase sigma factor [Baekduia sp.]|nr:sigma-70 family RNA polymerase sigma factor [Baekduia sp.]